jgi:hypothetical protein
VSTTQHQCFGGWASALQGVLDRRAQRTVAGQPGLTIGDTANSEHSKPLETTAVAVCTSLKSKFGLAVEKDAVASLMTAHDVITDVSQVHARRQQPVGAKWR